MKNRKLIDYRKSLELSRDDMAAKLKLSTSFYNKIEIGQRNPSFNFIKKVKENFPDIDIDDIFFDN